jgi:photosystem II stability/assembly factor-like uncharacterized protein
LLHSSDGATTWSPVSQNETPALPPFALPKLGIFLDPAHPATLYLFAGGFFKSADGGATLDPVGLFGTMVDLAVDPSGSGILYALTSRPRPLYKSADGGSTWKRVSAGLPAGSKVRSLVMDPTTPSTLYVMTEEGVWVSDDGAGSWQPLGDGLPPVPLLSIAAASDPAHTVYVGTAGAGIYSLSRQSP